MTSTNITPWEPFPVLSSSSPPLYLRKYFTNTSYTIYLTDLTSLWGESLDKSAILDRAEDRGCSIDPSTDDSQLFILLEKLSSGVTGLNSAVTVDLEIRGDTFNVNTKETLQAPLQPLEWRFRLKLLPAAKFTNHFLIPLLYMGSLLSRQTSSLLTTIQEKDATIARLLDKLEECKIETEWRREVLAVEPDSKSTKELVKATFRHLSRTEDEKLEVQLPRPSDAQWWTKVTGKVPVKGEPEVEPTAQATPRKPPKTVRLNTDSDDDFEALRSSPTRARVVEPPIPEKKEPMSDGQALLDETTEDEDDLDTIPKSQASHATTATKSSQRSPPPPPATATPSHSETLSNSPNPIKQESVDHTRLERNFDSQLAFIDTLGLNDDTTSEEDDEPTKPAPKKPRKSGLKKAVGGRRKKDEPKTIEEDDPMEDNGEKADPAPEPVADPEPPKRLGKIKGTIGGKRAGSETLKRKEPEPDSDEEKVELEQEAPKPPPRKKEKTKSPPIEGMDEDAAQRRREELQKQLAAKATTGKKKGRRF
ncbi:hypothetical protein ABW19_dt0200356 [Dactylella cylindrospora]|nr:hypothetical protein ABW19_dt0200356 [Dactylella cylindrospora]